LAPSRANYQEPMTNDRLLVVAQSSAELAEPARVSPQ
jgi:hypothetical protein